MWNKAIKLGNKRKWLYRPTAKAKEMWYGGKGVCYVLNGIGLWIW